MFDRFIPTLILGGGLALGAGPIIDMVKGVLTHAELVSIKDAMVTDWIGTCSPPPTDSAELADFITEIMRERGNRDVTKDHWGSPYGILDTGDNSYTLYSMGPNRQADGCGTYEGVSTDEWVNASPSEPGPGDSDDVCVDVTLGRCESVMRPIPP